MRIRSSSIAFVVLTGALVWFRPCENARAAEQGPLAAGVQPYVERQELAGAVMAIATKEKVLDVEAAGFADVAAKKPMQTDSVFWIASQSKPITCIAVMMLVEEGKIDLDAPVERYLPEFQGQMVVAEKDDAHVLLKKPARPPAVRDLLSHTSGLPFRSAIEVPTLDRLPLADRVRSYAMTPLEYEPGTKFGYSNAGINTAARIIEVVAGMPFEDFLDERLFQPLGMKDTTFWPNEEQVARLAKAYAPGPNGMGLVEVTIDQLHYPLTDRAARYPMPGGGLFSTAADLARLYQMLARGGELDGRRYLSQAAVEKMTDKRTPEGVKDFYGFGFQASTGQYGHGGAYSTNTYFDRTRNVILIWLVQHAGFPGKGAETQEAFRHAAFEHFCK